MHKMKSSALSEFGFDLSILLVYTMEKKRDSERTDFMERNVNKSIQRLTIVGLMAALVFVGNYMQIQIPNGILVTRIHLGNSMCLLAGLLFSGTIGGVSSGIGAALFDLFNPAYVLSSPYTFISKFAMGFVAGKLNRGGETKKSQILSAVIASVAAQAVYIVLYLVKSFFTVLIIGGTAEAAWIAVGTNAITSGVNAVLAVVIAVPLYFALKAALSRTSIKVHISEKSQSKGYFNPVTILLTVFMSVVICVFSIQLAAQPKIQAALEQEKAAVQEKLDEYEKKFDYLEKALNIDLSQFDSVE